MNTINITQLILIIDISLCVIGMIFVAIWVIAYRRTEKYHIRGCAIDIVFKTLRGEDIEWDTFVEFFKADSDGQPPRYEWGRAIFAEAKRILDENPTIDSKEAQGRIRNAQRSIPKSPDAANTEYGCNLVVAGMMIAGMFVTITGFRAANVWNEALGLVMTSIPSLIFIFGTFVVRRILVRHIRSLAERENQLAKLIKTHHL